MSDSATELSHAESIEKTRAWFERISAQKEKFSGYATLDPFLGIPWDELPEHVQNDIKDFYLA